MPNKVPSTSGKLLTDSEANAIGEPLKLIVLVVGATILSVILKDAALKDERSVGEDSLSSDED